MSSNGTLKVINESVNVTEDGDTAQLAEVINGSVKISESVKIGDTVIIEMKNVAIKKSEQPIVTTKNNEADIGKCDVNSDGKANKTTVDANDKIEATAEGTGVTDGLIAVKRNGVDLDHDKKEVANSGDGKLEDQVKETDGEVGSPKDATPDSATGPKSVDSKESGDYSSGHDSFGDECDDGDEAIPAKRTRGCPRGSAKKTQKKEENSISRKSKRCLRLADVIGSQKVDSDEEKESDD